MTYKIVQIEWIDSTSDENRWELLNEIEPVLPIHCISVGFLIDEKPEYKTIALNMSESGNQICGRITIPNVCIKNISILNFEGKEVKLNAAELYNP
jgi:hypothetical protein